MLVLDSGQRKHWNTYRYEPDVKIRPPASVATFSDKPCLMDTSCTNLVTSCWMLESSFSLDVSWDKHKQRTYRIFRSCSDSNWLSAMRSAMSAVVSGARVT